MLEILGSRLETIAIIDDEPASRESMGWVLADADLTAQPIEGPLQDALSLSSRVASETQAMICDHNLGARNYAPFHGAHLVAVSVRRGFPSILCTRFKGPDIAQIRPLLAHIPVLCRPDELNEPDEVVRALTDCISELKGDPPPSRRLWQTQLIVERRDDEAGLVDVWLPYWDIDSIIRLPLSGIPRERHHDLEVGARLHVTVNLGAEDPDRLFVAKWDG